jgi:hypothetical protein
LLQVNDILAGRFRILELIAMGGEGNSYKSLDQQSGNHVAIKHLVASVSAPDHQRQEARFRRAATVRIGHPNVIDALDCLDEKGELYLVMPFVDGMDLECHLRAAGGRLAPDAAVQFLLQLAEALAALHRHGIVHRDIKPLNIMVKPDGTLVVVDLGICRVMNEKTITNGEILGTPAWMAPEQTHSAHVDQRADLFSLGLVIWMVLTGVPPVQAPDPETAKRIIRETDLPSPACVVPGIPSQLNAICARLLARQPDQRFQSADELCQALRQLNTPAAGFCRSCGHAMAMGAQFCSVCGAALAATQAVQLCFACRAPAESAAVCPGCRRPFSPHDHRLAFQEGSAAGVVFRLPEGIYVVGRDVIEPRDYSISRKHLQVCCSNGQVFVQDAGSANQTYVAGQVANQALRLLANQDLVIAQNRAVFLTT